MDNVYEKELPSIKVWELCSNYDSRASYLLHSVFLMLTFFLCVSGLNAVFRTGNPFLSKRNKGKEEETSK